MPGTTKLEFYTMPLADALSILAVDADVLTVLGVRGADVDELRRAARWVVERHAEEVAYRCLAPARGQPNHLKLVDDHDRKRRREADDARQR